MRTQPLGRLLSLLLVLGVSRTSFAVDQAQLTAAETAQTANAKRLDDRGKELAKTKEDLENREKAVQADPTKKDEKLAADKEAYEKAVKEHGAERVSHAINERGLESARQRMAVDKGAAAIDKSIQDARTEAAAKANAEAFKKNGTAPASLTDNKGNTYDLKYKDAEGKPYYVDPKTNRVLYGEHQKDGSFTTSPLPGDRGATPQGLEYDASQIVDLKSFSSGRMYQPEFSGGGQQLANTAAYQPGSGEVTIAQSTVAVARYLATPSEPLAGVTYGNIGTNQSGASGLMLGGNFYSGSFQPNAGISQFNLPNGAFFQATNGDVFYKNSAGIVMRKPAPSK